MQDKNCDGILSHPIRVGFEGVSQALSRSTGVIHTDDFFELCFTNQHPLWIAQNWESPLFSKMPYHVIWSDSESLVVRPFSISPIIFRPNWDIVNMGGNLDIYALQFIEKPYYVVDWS